MITLIISLSIAYGYFRHVEKNTTKKYLLKDTFMETSIFYMQGKTKGPYILVIAGIHGNEVAGIKAAEVLTKYTPKKGKLTIIPKSNIEACKKTMRFPYYMQDLNRSFPGKRDGTDTEKLAYEIYTFIEKENPDLILDLHEWDLRLDDDNLSNAIVAYSIDQKLLPLLLELNNLKDDKSQNYTIDILTDPPKGSLNREVSENLKIPVLTVETNMEKDIKTRIDTHLIITHTILDYFEMREEQ